MGAVLGSKHLKALVFLGTREIAVADAAELDRLGAEAKKSLIRKDGYRFWKRQGTTATVEWCQGVGTLPTRNFREGVFEGAEAIGGDAVEKVKSKEGPGLPAVQHDVRERGPRLRGLRG